MLISLPEKGGTWWDPPSGNQYPNQTRNSPASTRSPLVIGPYSSKKEAVRQWRSARHWAKDQEMAPLSSATRRTRLAVVEVVIGSGAFGLDQCSRSGVRKQLSKQLISGQGALAGQLGAQGNRARPRFCVEGVGSVGVVIGAVGESLAGDLGSDLLSEGERRGAGVHESFAVD